MWFKIYIQKFTLSHALNTPPDVIDLVNHRMVKNTKTWISWERYITFLRNKKSFNLCQRWHILRNYRFVAEVIFKNWMQENIRYNNKWKTETIQFCIILRVDWDFNISALHKFGYGDKFIDLVKDVYTNIQSKIKVNGFLSHSFTLTWEVCQGCLSPYAFLYIIEAKVLASFINPKKRTNGIQIRNYEIKMVNFADDTTIFITDITCLNRIRVILKLYENASNSKINFLKSKALCTNFIKILGVNFGNSIL